MRRLEWLEAMRGIAALWVVFHHGMQASVAFLGSSNVRVFANGLLGVDFFFILSGYIITLSSQKLLERGGGLREYALSRALRIYVPYFPVGIAMVILYAALPGVSEGNRPTPGLFTSLTLLPSNSPPALSVAWTLVHEIVFYAVFSVFFFSRRLVIALMTLWVTAIVGTWLSEVHLSRAALYLLSPVNLCFAAGAGLSVITRNGVPDRLAGLLVSTGVLLIAFQANAVEPNRVVVALGFAALVASACSPAALSRTPGPVLMLLGAASYSIYLLHNTTQGIVVRLVGELPSWIGFALLVIIGAIVGIAYHLWYERVALRILRRRISHIPPAAQHGATP